MSRHFLRALAAILALACGAAAAETITVNGVKRTFSVRLADVKPAPLVIALHGNTQTGADMASRTSWPAVAKREHFTVMFPDGLNRAWADLRSSEMRAGRTPPEGTDDIAFIARLVETYVSNGTADPEHVYVTGVSNGGAMTMTLACKRADLFAAAASVIMNFTDEFASACQPSRPVPMLVMNGTADPLIPYEGGRGTSRFAVDGFWSAEKTIAFWRKVNGCEEGDAAEPTSPTTTRTTSRR
jgi:polyhydroxybutyrate depolymerase